MPPSIDEASIERRCIRLLQQVDRGDRSLVSPDGPYRCSAAMVTAMGWMYLDLDRATRELETITSAQLDDGSIPSGPGAPGCCLPVLASVFRMVYHAARGRQRSLEPRLAQLVGLIDRFHVALSGRDRRGLCVFSPDDDRVARSAAAVAPTIEVGLNALLTQAESDLADVAIHTGYPTRAIVARRTHRAQAVAERLWDPERRSFASRAVDGGQQSPIQLEDALPLWAGAAVRHQAAALVAEHLSPPNGLWTALPLSTTPPTDGNETVVDPLLNWLMVRGLYRYGHDELARELSEATLQLAAEHGLHESYSGQTGAPVGCADWAPTAAVVLDLLKTPYYYDRW